MATIYAISRISMSHAQAHTDYMSAQAAFLVLADDQSAHGLYRYHLKPIVELMNDFLVSLGVSRIDTHFHVDMEQLGLGPATRETNDVRRKSCLQKKTWQPTKPIKSFLSPTNVARS